MMQATWGKYPEKKIILYDEINKKRKRPTNESCLTEPPTLHSTVLTPGYFAEMMVE